MGQSRNMLILAFMTSAFVVALSVALGLLSSVSESLSVVKERTSYDRAVYTGLNDKVNDQVKGSTVIQSIYLLLDGTSNTFVPGVADSSQPRKPLSIMVGNNTYTSDMDKNTLNLSAIDANASYKPTYTYVAGSLTRVTYVKI